jgi:hypothetical protein
MTESWSDLLIEQTRNALADKWVGGLDGFLHLKNINGKFGKICFENLMAERWLIHVKNSTDVNTFANVEDLISAGWAID